MQCLKHGLDFLLGEWMQLQLKLRGWISSFRAMSISSPKKKKTRGFLQNEEEQNSCLKAKGVYWQTGRNGDARGNFAGRIFRLPKNIGEMRQKRFFYCGLQLKMQIIKGFENILLNTWMKDNEHMGVRKLLPSWADFAFVQSYTGTTGDWTLLPRHFRHQKLLNVDTSIFCQTAHCIHPFPILRQLRLQSVRSAWVLGHSSAPREVTAQFLSLHHITACQSH